MRMFNVDPDALGDGGIDPDELEDEAELERSREKCESYDDCDDCPHHDECMGLECLERQDVGRERLARIAEGLHGGE